MSPEMKASGSVLSTICWRCDQKYTTMPSSIAPKTKLGSPMMILTNVYYGDSG